MSYVKAFILFWYDFLIGDDWLGAAIAIAGFAGTWGLTRAGLPAFWLLPLAVPVSVGVSLWRRARVRQSPRV